MPPDRITLAHLPTPIEPLARLSAHLGGPKIFVKRDDCTGLAFGGNKTRKLEFLMAEALAAGADCVITAGGVQSNHVRQTAAAARRLGLTAELVLSRAVPDMAPEYERSGNIQIDRLLGAQVHYCATSAERDPAMQRLAQDLHEAGRRPYLIPLGGSNSLGAMGYVACLQEIARQESELDVTFDYLVLASSSGGTQAGLVAGAAHSAHRLGVIGIDVDGEPDPIRHTVEALARETLERLGSGDPAIDVRVEGGYAGKAYGVPSREGLEAIELLARLEGLLLDPVYTGKAMAGLIDLVRKGRFTRGERVLFLHSGGSPALFAYRSFFEAQQSPDP